jgi:hypothetical protein
MKYSSNEKSDKQFDNRQHDLLLPKVNDDGISVKGCSIIYAPRGQVELCAEVGDGMKG